MNDKRFEIPVLIRLGDNGAEREISSAKDASDILLSGWPGKRGAKHRAALQACHDVLSKDRPAEPARRAFVAAAREANAYVGERPRN